MKLKQFWTLLDTLPGASCARRDWQADLGREFTAVEPLLQPTGTLAESVGCPHPFGDECPRSLVTTEAGSFRAVCENRSNRCDTLELSQKDVMTLKLDRAALSARLAEALSLAPGRKPDMQASVWHAGDRRTGNGARIPVFIAVVDKANADKASIFDVIAGALRPSLLLVPTQNTLGVEQTSYVAKNSVTFRPIADMVDIGDDGSFAASLLGCQVFNELESKASALIDQTSRCAWQLPQGTDWSKVTIDFIADEWINVRCGPHTRHFEPEELGLKSKKNGKPKSAWEFLKRFALAGGVLPLRWAAKPAIVEKQKQELSQSLRKSFGLDADPILAIDGEYRTRFRVSASGLSQGRAGQASRKIGNART